MRLKKLMAVTLGLTMLCAVPAYASEADAIATYQQMEAKSEELNDMDAYYDFKMGMTDGTDSVNARFEMNMKANQLKNLEQLKMNVYARMTLEDMSSGAVEAEGPGTDAISIDLSDAVMTFNVYYENGMYYMDMMGQKVKYPMPLAEMMTQVQSATSLVGSSVEYMQNMDLHMDGEDRVITYTMDAANMNSLLESVLNISGLQENMAAAGLSMSYRDISGEYIVAPDGNCKKAKMKATMDMTMEGTTLMITMDGDVGFANPGQPVEIQTPNLAEYPLMEDVVQ